MRRYEARYTATRSMPTSAFIVTWSFVWNRATSTEWGWRSFVGWSIVCRFNRACRFILNVVLCVATSPTAIHSARTLHARNSLSELPPPYTSTCSSVAFSHCDARQLSKIYGLVPSVVEQQLLYMHSRSEYCNRYVRSKSKQLALSNLHE